ncbi:MAG: hypothetical protein GY856_37295, partial [bacterium]|nr:hypothetical protein [bacterium]
MNSFNALELLTWLMVEKAKRSAVQVPAPESAGGLSWISVSLERGRRIGAVALSLDLDPSVYDLAGIAAHAGGFPGAARVPGAVRYPNAVPELAMLIVNVDDVD